MSRSVFSDDLWTSTDEQYLSDLAQSDWQFGIADDDLSWLIDNTQAAHLPEVAKVGETDFVEGIGEKWVEANDVDDMVFLSNLSLLDDESEIEQYQTHYLDTLNDYIDDSTHDVDDEDFWLDTAIHDTLENIVPDDADGLTQQQRGEQIAAQLLYDFEWDRRYLPFLVEIFSQPYRGATRQALYRAVEKNISPQEIMVAYSVKEYWHHTSHFHYSIKNHQVYSKYIWISWNFAFDILNCFEGVPDADEVCFHLEQLYDYWSNYVMPKLKNSEFIQFVGNQIKQPVELWLTYNPVQNDELAYDLPEFNAVLDRPNAWLVAQNALHHQDRYLINHHYDDKSYALINHQKIDNQMIQKPLSVWEQHCQIMFQAASQNLKVFEILKLIPLNHEDWCEDALTYFKLNQLDNVYQALGIIKIQDTSIVQSSKILIRKYIDEVKKYLGD